jgi:UrcA family protein
MIMTYTTTKFSDFWHGSMLAALTACMAFGLADVARSATPDSAPAIRVPFGDLNLTTDQGTSAFHARVAAAARQVCSVGREDSRNLQAWAAERSCEAQAIVNAERDVHAVAASFAARHEPI